MGITNNYVFFSLFFSFDALLNERPNLRPQLTATWKTPSGAQLQEHIQAVTPEIQRAISSVHVHAIESEQ